MLTSNTQACNLALIEIGASTINDISDSTDRNAVLCDQLFQPTLDSLLASSEIEWSCAIARVSLSQLVNSTYSEFEYLYSLPSFPKVLRAIMLLSYEGWDDYNWHEMPDARFIIEGQRLHTNYDSVALKYIGQITDVTELDTWVGDAFVSLLAWKLSLRLTEDKTKRQMKQQEAGAMIRNAMTIDRLHSRNRHKPAPRWENIG